MRQSVGTSVELGLGYIMEEISAPSEEGSVVGEKRQVTAHRRNSFYFGDIVAKVKSHWCLLLYFL